MTEATLGPWDERQHCDPGQSSWEAQECPGWISGGRLD